MRCSVLFGIRFVNCYGLHGCKLKLSKVSADLSIAEQLDQDAVILGPIPNMTRNDSWMNTQFINQGMQLAPETF